LERKRASEFLFFSMKGIKEVLAQTIKNDEIVRSEAPMSV